MKSKTLNKKIINREITQKKQVGIVIDRSLNNLYLSLPMKTQIINDLLNSLLLKETQKK